MIRRTDIPLSYPFDWTGLEDFSTYRYDDQGLPQVPYGPPIGLRYNPITIAQFGLFHLQRFDRSANRVHREMAFRCGEWLVRNAVLREDGASVWVFDFDLPFYGPQAPWISAMAQGEAISLLLRLASLDDRPRYVETACAAVRVLDLTVEQQGVLDHLAEEYIFFEEYPTRPASHVLNGHIFALLGAHDFFLFSGRPEDKERLQRSLQTLLHRWQDFDVGYWTRYDLHPSARLASRMYQEVHVRQMLLLGRLFKEPEFIRVAERWHKMRNSTWCNTRWLAAKIMEKVREAI